MSWRYWRFCSRAAYVVLGSAVAGCYGGDGLPRQPVSGSVMLNGRLLKSGVISFYPSARMLEGTMTTGGDVIKNGRFAIPRSEGLIPGKYTVGVYAASGRGSRRKVESQPGTAEVVPPESIPTKYNSNSQLEIEIQNHAIKEMTLELKSN
jgi:hypothetical protein